MMKKIVVVFIVPVIIITSVLPNLHVTSKDFIPSFVTKKTDGYESYVIACVPYVGQETDFYCAYASPTMIFKYYGKKQKRLARLNT